MTTKFLSGSVVALEVTLDPAVTITSAAYTVYDETRAVIVASTPIVLGASLETITVTVPALSNTLAPGVARSYRTVEIEGVLSTGELKVYRNSYILEAVVPEEIPGTTFQTYEQAVLNSLDLTDIPGWSMADEEARKKALKEAHFRINSLRFDLIEASEFPDFPGLVDIGFRGQIGGMTLAEFNELPKVFLDALKQAQVIEADSVLSGGGLEQKRLDGVSQIVVGESSTTFIKSRPAKSYLSKRASDRLGRFVDQAYRLGRG